MNIKDACQGYDDEELKAELERRANAPKMPDDLAKMRDECYEVEYWRPEYFYFAVDDNGDDRYYVFLTRWEWFDKDTEEARRGYFRFDQCLPKGMKQGDEECPPEFHDLVGGDETDLIKAGFEQKQEILELFT